MSKFSFPFTVVLKPRNWFNGKKRRTSFVPSHSLIRPSLFLLLLKIDFISTLPIVLSTFFSLSPFSFSFVPTFLKTKVEGGRKGIFSSHFITSVLSAQLTQREGGGGGEVVSPSPGLICISQCIHPVRGGKKKHRQPTPSSGWDRWVERRQWQKSREGSSFGRVEEGEERWKIQG